MAIQVETRITISNKNTLDDFLYFVLEPHFCCVKHCESSEAKLRDSFFGFNNYFTFNRKAALILRICKRYTSCQHIPSFVADTSIR